MTGLDETQGSNPSSGEGTPTETASHLQGDQSVGQSPDLSQVAQAPTARWQRFSITEPISYHQRGRTFFGKAFPGPTSPSASLAAKPVTASAASGPVLPSTPGVTTSAAAAPTPASHLTATTSANASPAPGLTSQSTPMAENLADANPALAPTLPSTSTASDPSLPPGTYVTGKKDFVEEEMYSGPSLGVSKSAKKRQRRAAAKSANHARS